MNDFIKFICDELNIKQPKLSYDTSKFLTSTQLAMLHNGTIYVKKQNPPTPDLYFSVVHELRHQWQLENDADLYFADYKQTGSISVEDYNLQLAEIDANAYAGAMMTRIFKLKPLYYGLSDKVKNKIAEYQMSHNFFITP